MSIKFYLYVVLNLRNPKYTLNIYVSKLLPKVGTYIHIGIYVCENETNVNNFNLQTINFYFYDIFIVKIQKND